MLSYAWRGSKGSGKKTALLKFLRDIYGTIHKDSSIFRNDFLLQTGTWIMNKNGTSITRDNCVGVGIASLSSRELSSNNEEQSSQTQSQIQNFQGAGGDDDDELEGKRIPYEFSQIHLGFDVARMSMSDKIFLNSILQRWTGQDDLTLTTTTLPTRYLVLYHAHLLTDESILQIQETLEKFDNFGVLMTTELPICSRLSDHVFEIPVPGYDRLFEEYRKKWEPTATEDCWLTFFRMTLDKWTTTNSYKSIFEIREWVYTCLQRNLRWTDMIYYWILVLEEITWLSKEERSKLWFYLANIESGGGWNLIPSYRIPIFWESVHAEFAEKARQFRENKKGD